MLEREGTVKILAPDLRQLQEAQEASTEAWYTHRSAAGSKKDFNTLRLERDYEPSGVVPKLISEE